MVFVDDLRLMYAENAELHGKAIEAGDSERANAAHDAVIEAYRQLRSEGDAGLAVLKMLMGHENRSVRGWAATHCLPVNEKEAVAALKALASGPGATIFTHLGNGLPNLIHRHHNPIWAALACDALAVTLITDGHHLPPPAIKTILRAKGPDRCAVVSDASHLAGLPPGRYSTIDNEVVLEPSGKLHNPAKQCLVGSSAVMMQCMNHLARLGILSPDELLAVGFHNPLRLLGLPPSAVRGRGELRYDEAGRLFCWTR